MKRLKPYIALTLLLTAISAKGAVLGGYDDTTPALRTAPTPAPAPSVDLTTQTSTAVEAPTPAAVEPEEHLIIEEQVAQEPHSPPQPEKSQEQLKREAAFDLLKSQALPLSPDQIKTLHKLYDLTQQASATPPNSPPTPISSSIVVNLSPGNTPPIIRLSAGFVSSLVFVDSTGQPWPITAYSLGDPESFNIQWDQRTNALFIQSLQLYTHGNLAIRLQDLNTPIMLSLVSGQKEVDFRVDLQIVGRGPEAVAPIVPDSVTEAKINPVLINILDGIPPQGSNKLNVSGNHGEAWMLNNKVYFRTKLTVLSPAWNSTVSSPDGTHVYEMMKTPLILASQNGKTVNITLTGL